MNSKPIIEFVGLRAKMYSMLTPDSEKKTAKGVSKCTRLHAIEVTDKSGCHLMNSNLSHYLQREPMHVICVDAQTSSHFCGGGSEMRVPAQRILFSDEAHFWLNGYVYKQNCRIWREANPQVYVETPLHPEKLTVWCALWAVGILLQKR
ncbi:hypothetical protein TNCV_251611 [Trichonephila clavipes]|nr:hypothetical protein TNCV_251611 [Trichonephila clavipes]